MKNYAIIQKNYASANMATAPLKGKLQAKSKTISYINISACFALYRRFTAFKTMFC